MANKPLATPPVGDLPVNWRNGQIVSVNGTATGLTAKHGYNYLMQKVNDGINALNEINNAFVELAELEDGRVPAAQLPAMLKTGIIRVTLPSAGWQSTSGGGAYGWRQDVTIAELQDIPDAVLIADINASASITSAIIDGWSKVSTVKGAEGAVLRFECFEDAPAVDIPLILSWFAPQSSTGGATQPYTEYETGSGGYIIGAAFYGGEVPRGAFSGSNGYGRLNTVRISEGCEAILDYSFSTSGITAISLPNSLKYIDGNAFLSCLLLEEITIPAAVEFIARFAFRNCTALKTVTFQGTPEEINANAFAGCSALLTINVPWAEGAVAGAPWGATNATINYNSL